MNQEVDWNLCILQESKEGNLSTVSNWFIDSLVHFNSGFAVVHYAFLDQTEGNLREFTVQDGVLSGVFDYLVLFTVKLGNLHVSSGNGASLATADFFNRAHFLWSI